MPEPSSWFVSMLAWSVPASVALTAFFSWIMLINSLRVPFYLYYERTIFLIYASRSLDPLIWLASSGLTLVLVAIEGQGRSHWSWPSVLLLWLGTATGALATIGVMSQQLAAVGALATLAGCSLAGKAATRPTTPSRARFVLVFLLVLCLLILPAELGSMLYYVLSAFHLGIDIGRSWEMLEMQLWYTAFPLVPFLYVASLFSWVWAPLIIKIASRSTGQTCNSARTRVETKGHLGWLVAACACILMSLFIGYYPYFHNPTYNLVGTDIYFNYVVPAQRVLASQSWIAAFAQWHPVVVLAIAMLARFSGMTVESLLRIAYVALILAFSAAVFLLALLTSGNKNLASLSALIATISPLTTAGMYTGIVANWVAMIIWVLSFISLSTGRGQGLRRYAIPILGLAFGSLAALFIHPWTWMAMMVALVAYVAIAIFFRLQNAVRDAVVVSVAIVLNAGALLLILLVLPKAQGWRIAEAFSFVQTGLQSRYLGLGSWEIVVFFVQTWSQFLSPMLLLLSILGALFLASRRDRYSAIVFAWLMAACATNLLAAPVGYNPVAVGRGQTQIFRAFFLTPFQILSAPAFLLIGSELEARLSEITHNRASRVVLWVVLGVIFLTIVNGALRALFPLLTDPHNCPTSSC